MPLQENKFSSSWKFLVACYNWPFECYYILRGIECILVYDYARVCMCVLLDMVTLQHMFLEYLNHLLSERPSTENAWYVFRVETIPWVLTSSGSLQCFFTPFCGKQDWLLWRCGDTLNPGLTEPTLKGVSTISWSLWWSDMNCWWRTADWLRMGVRLGMFAWLELGIWLWIITWLSLLFQPLPRDSCTEGRSCVKACCPEFCVQLEGRTPKSHAALLLCGTGGRIRMPPDKFSLLCPSTWM